MSKRMSRDKAVDAIVHVRNHRSVPDGYRVLSTIVETELKRTGRVLSQGNKRRPVGVTVFDDSALAHVFNLASNDPTSRRVSLEGV